MVEIFVQSKTWRSPMDNNVIIRRNIVVTTFNLGFVLSTPF